MRNHGKCGKTNFVRPFREEGTITTNTSVDTTTTDAPTTITAAAEDGWTAAAADVDAAMADTTIITRDGFQSRSAKFVSSPVPMCSLHYSTEVSRERVEKQNEENSTCIRSP